MDSRLLGEVAQGAKAVAGVKALLVLSVVALDLPIVARHIGTDELMVDAEPDSGFLKRGGQAPSAVEKAVGKRKPVVSLNTLRPDVLAGIPLD